MDSTESTLPTVLIVEDERGLADLYADWLSETCDVRLAYDGEEAFERLDDTIDVVLLDRRMPTLSGGAVLETIREEGLGCRVAMVTAVDPDFDIVHMPFDEYLVKPVSKSELRRTVDRLLRRERYSRRLQEYFSIATKKAILESEMSPAELSKSAEYTELLRQFVDVQEETQELQKSLDQDDYEALFRELDREGTSDRSSAVA